MSRIYQGGITIGDIVFIFDMDTFETRTSWGHEGELTIVFEKGYDTIEKVYNKDRYQNRTWEKYEGQSMMRHLIDKLSKSTRKQYKAEIDELLARIERASSPAEVKKLGGSPKSEATVTEAKQQPLTIAMPDSLSVGDIDLYGVENGKTLWVEGEQYVMPEQGVQGVYFKSVDAYSDGGLAYVPEYGFEDLQVYVLDIMSADRFSDQMLDDPINLGPWYRVDDIYANESGFTKESIMHLVKQHLEELKAVYTKKDIGVEALAYDLFDQLDWQYPESLLQDLISMDDVNSDGMRESKAVNEDGHYNQFAGETIKHLLFSEDFDDNYDNAAAISWYDDLLSDGFVDEDREEPRTDDEKVDYMRDYYYNNNEAEMAWDDLRVELDVIYNETVLVKADLGRWNGRSNAEQSYDTLKDAIEKIASSYRGAVNPKIYIDKNNDLIVTMSHHDATDKFIIKTSDGQPLGKVITNYWGIEDKPVRHDEARGREKFKMYLRRDTDFPSPELLEISRKWTRLANAYGDEGSCVVGAGFDFVYNGVNYFMRPRSQWQGSMSWEDSVDEIKQDLVDIGATDIYYNWGNLD